MYDDRIAGKQSAVCIQCSRLLVEVAGTDISVTVNLFTGEAATAYQSYFGMYLQPRYTIDNVDTGRFHHFGSGEVVLFIETGFEFHEYRDFFTVLCSSNQGVDDSRVFCYPILGYHDFTGFGIVHCFVKEVDKVVERMVRIV